MWHANRGAGCDSMQPLIIPALACPCLPLSLDRARHDRSRATRCWAGSEISGVTVTTACCAPTPDRRMYAATLTLDLWANLQFARGSRLQKAWASSQQPVRGGKSKVSPTLLSFNRLRWAATIILDLEGTGRPFARGPITTGKLLGCAHSATTARKILI